jgi:hypothetical protein
VDTLLARLRRFDVPVAAPLLFFFPFAMLISRRRVEIREYPFATQSRAGSRPVSTNSAQSLLQLNCEVAAPVKGLRKHDIAKYRASPQSKPAA